MDGTYSRIEALDINVSDDNGKIKLYTDNICVVLSGNGLEWTLINNAQKKGNNEDWENFSSEVDNLNRAIFWIRAFQKQ